MQEISISNFLYELRVESLEDLWILSQFITPNDILYAKDERKVKIGSGENQKQVKKIIPLELEVKKIEFREQSLRIQGVILNETEFTAVGQSHSLQFGINDVLKIQKKRILRYEKNLIEKSIKIKKSLNLLILLDREELIVCEFSSFSFKVLFEHKGLGSKKYISEEINENEQKYKLIKDVLNKKYDTVICAGPGSYKESLGNFIQEKEKIKVLTYKYPEVSASAVQKTINEINKSGILKENEIAKDSEAVKILLEKINTKKSYAYGIDDVEEKTNSGAIEQILLSTKFIEKCREDNNYSKIDQILINVEKIGGSISILNSKHEPGQILDGLGGVAAILRY